MKLIGRTLLTGLAAIVPLIVTLYLIYWLVVTAERVLGDVFRYLLPQGWYLPGMGVAAGLVVTFLIGLLMHAWVVQSLYGWAEKLLYRIPLIRSVYGSIRDLFDLFSHAQEKSLHQTVVLSMGQMRLIGFVTRWELNDMSKEISETDNVAVYLPMSYMIGGYLVMVPRSEVHPIDMSVENALRFILTAGITGNQAEHPAVKPKTDKTEC